MNMTPLVRFAGAALCAVLIAGCGSTQSERDLANPPQPLLTGQASYFNGTIAVDASLGPFRIHGPSEREGGGRVEGGTAEHERSGRKKRSEEGGRNFEGGEGGGAGYSQEYTASNEEADSTDYTERLRAPRWIPSSSRQTLVIKLRNTGSQPAKIDVKEINCPIGNFVPIPETFDLAPGAEKELEPMRTSYPSAIEQLSVTVRIDSNGADESKTITLNIAGSGPPGR